ncbi:VOC family protein [Teredinibacter franksiae]|uniref:VOC family protein n=1 Tax=Teredinibacter franksiae TaxID=2761453 RepID=UPI001624911C|nr:VOC family protein [Teredinibacter franksiae]
MNISFHLDFNGECREAFEYYGYHLGGKIGMLLQYKDSPHAENVSSEWQGKVAHANIRVGNIELSGADVRPDQYEKPKGFYILLNVVSAEDVKSIFSEFCLEGDVILPLQKTFWSECYGMVVDRFGIPWKINCGAQ